MPNGEPQYKLYRSRRGLLSRLRPGGAGGLAGLGRLREEPGGARRLSLRRVLGFVALLVGAWLALSLVVFLISAQIQQNTSDRTNDALSGGGSMLTGSTVLVLGSDARPRGSKEPGAGGAPRSDSILLVHASLGDVRRVSVLRDSYAQIPGHGAQKINAAYALGGAALAIDTVEGFLGNDLRIDHVVEVNFEEFPRFIDAMGGIDIETKRPVRSQPFGNARRGFRLSKGEHRLSGRRALAYARMRKNLAAPNETDAARAARQQQVMSAIRSRLLSPATFARLPLVSWQAPKTIRTDMAGPALLGLFADVVIGGAGKTTVLRSSGAGPAGSETISEEEKRRAVRELTR